MKAIDIVKDVLATCWVFNDRRELIPRRAYLETTRGDFQIVNSMSSHLDDENLARVPASYRVIANVLVEILKCRFRFDVMSEQGELQAV